jgi:hypothetical protein
LSGGRGKDRGRRATPPNRQHEKKALSRSDIEGMPAIAELAVIPCTPDHPVAWPLLLMWELVLKLSQEHRQRLTPGISDRHRVRQLAVVQSQREDRPEVCAGDAKSQRRIVCDVQQTQVKAAGLSCRNSWA